MSTIPTLSQIAFGPQVDPATQVTNALQTPTANTSVVPGINAVGGTTPTTPTGISSMLERLGLIGEGGEFLGIGDKAWGNMGAAAGIGKSLFDMYNANNMFGITKDYYRDQTALQREAANRSKDEYNRLTTARSNLNRQYSGTPQTSSTQVG